jgi:hypothetical protein
MSFSGQGSCFAANMWKNVKDTIRGAKTLRKRQQDNEKETMNENGQSSESRNTYKSNNKKMDTNLPRRKKIIEYIKREWKGKIA